MLCFHGFDHSVLTQQCFVAIQPELLQCWLLDTPVIFCRVSCTLGGHFKQAKIGFSEFRQDIGIFVFDEEWVDYKANLQGGRPLPSPWGLKINWRRTDHMLRMDWFQYQNLCQDWTPTQILEKGLGRGMPG